MKVLIYDDKDNNWKDAPQAEIDAKNEELFEWAAQAAEEKLKEERKEDIQWTN